MSTPTTSARGAGAARWIAAGTCVRIVLAPVIMALVLAGEEADVTAALLFADVAAMRAKQLRRGALPRLDDDADFIESHRPHPHKAERVAMEEVKRGLVLYDVPDAKQVAQ